MERRNPIKGSPLLVHCSAGVGRTGVFLMLRVLLDKLKRRVIPNLGDILEELRRQRMLLVQTPSQYVFCHEAAIAALKDPSVEYY
jgi:protein tyrosine phosphatase